METHYTILEIQDSATPEEIKDSYRLLLQVWHPDRFHHRPALLAKAEEKSGKINVAFETLSDPVLKQQYDDWLRACRGPSAKTVESVTCPSCHTMFRSAPDQHESWDTYQRRHRATEEHNHSTGATTQGNQPFPRAKMAMVAIGALFTIVIVFVLTKPSKILVSNKPPKAVEQETLPEHEPLAVEEKEVIHRDLDVRDRVATSAAQADERGTPPRNTPPTKSQERMDHPEFTQRLMAQTPGRSPASPEEMISAVDQQQLLRLAAQGNASAQNQLGQLYSNGRGVPQDYATARKWYEKAAAQGHGWAQNQLGQLSADGLGIPQDYKNARHWWEQAAALGVAQAQYNLGQLFSNGRGVPQNYAAAREWYEKAAAQGHTWAQAQLGQLYANGRGVQQDLTTARKWYEKAAAQGNAWAQAQLAML
ncbi:MAG TPA: DnaJ domain-containing protein [Nitrospiraceae bacterium]|nr:DnaJ domain-containing protein [Nitrospiraceae bacterium]